MKVKEKRWEKIENSRYYRDFCVHCGEPIRIFSKDIYKENSCNICNGHSSIDRRHICNLNHLIDYDDLDIDA